MRSLYYFFIPFHSRFLLIAYDYLDELETRAIEAVDRQVELWKKSDKEYLSSILSGDEMKQVRLTNCFRNMAKEIIYDSIIYA